MNNWEVWQCLKKTALFYLNNLFSFGTKAGCAADGDGEGNSDLSHCCGCVTES